MTKSLYLAENRQLCAQLRDVREAAGMSQAELAGKFGRLQSFVSTVERGLVRLDGIQLRQWCVHCGTSFPAFAETLEERIKALPPAKVVRAPRKLLSKKRN